jgi:hypothetical protein
MSRAAAGVAAQAKASAIKQPIPSFLNLLIM